MLSAINNIPIILRQVEIMKPKRVLDIGAGMGKFGMLIREQYLSRKAEQGELQPVDDIVIDAVEDTKYLLTDRMKGLYNRVFEKDIFNCYHQLEDYDLILLIDTIEHWEKEKALDLIRVLLNKGAVMVSTPKRTGMYKQHFYGDPRHHITQYTDHDFDTFQWAKRIESVHSHIILIPKR
jgi:2-polyprenyl-3-methyl-5-hydroxy-6-metoxy-1,4-benzoquinol methylase